MDQWHSRHIQEVIRRLNTSPQRGLTPGEASGRIAQYGRNQLEEPQAEGGLKRFFAQMKDPMILVLLGAAVLSLVASGGEDWMDALIILVIVGVNAFISISQEDDAQRALAALRQMSAPVATVVRGGEQVLVSAAELVPGDIVVLEAGDLVPADGRILESANLKADESTMTGESLPVSKRAIDTLPPETVLGDRKNMVISATVITNGRATVVVTATGMDTQVGRIAHLLMGQEESETPLQRKMAEVSKTLSFACLSVCGVMFGIGLLQQQDMLTMFMTAVSLAVAAIPEGLPAIVTIVLAMGLKRMVKRNAIVKKLPAVETLGCASVICSDKTGTLTQNKMTVVEVWTRGDASNRGLALTIGALCNDARLSHSSEGEILVRGDPTEGALVRIAAQEGWSKNDLEQGWPRQGEIPFDAERKRMSTVHRNPQGGYRIMVKGAPDVLVGRCNRICGGGGTVQMTAAHRRHVAATNEKMAGQALRVLGLAYRDVAAMPHPMSPENVEQDLVFVGLMGMIDPPRVEVKRAVAQCYGAGIRPVMITGDHKLTAVAIAQALDIFKPGDLALCGEDLDFMPQEILEQEIEKFSVFARVSPEHKMRIVQAWQKRGNVVAMTGDGVNDAPALKVADIGCAMGLAGTDVAKGASDMILTDDNFATIVCAVEEGRSVYSNIKKAVHYLLSCNIGEMITIFFATVFGFHQMPLVPVQLLWLNLVTDALPALALGVEPVEEGVMERKPRNARESLFTAAFSIRLAWQGVMIGALTLAAYYLGEYVLGDPLTADSTANTMAFATLTFCQLFHAFDVRSERQSIFRIGVTSNGAMNKAFLVGLVMQVSVLTVPPLQLVFSTTHLDVTQWLVVLGLALVPVVVCETIKKIGNRKK